MHDYRNVFHQVKIKVCSKKNLIFWVIKSLLNWKSIKFRSYEHQFISVIRGRVSQMSQSEEKDRYENCKKSKIILMEHNFNTIWRHLVNTSSCERGRKTNQPCSRRIRKDESTVLKPCLRRIRRSWEISQKTLMQYNTLIINITKEAGERFIEGAGKDSKFLLFMLYFLKQIRRFLLYFLSGNICFWWAV